MNEKNEIVIIARLYCLVISTQIPKIAEPTIPPAINRAPKRLASSAENPNASEASPMIVPRQLNTPYT